MIKKIIKKKPLLNSLRHSCVLNKSNLWKGKCVKHLSSILKRNSFKSSNGRKLMRTRRGFVRKRYRFLDYKKAYFGIPCNVLRIEYNPYITSFIALVLYSNGLLCYINTSRGFFPGAVVGSYIRTFRSNDYFFSKGDNIILSLVSPGTIVSNIEKMPNLGSVYVRAAGTFAKFLRKTSKHAYIQFPKKKIKKFTLFNKALIGHNLNSSNKAIVLGKAGKSYWRGRKPVVRGVATNPVDHPHGGGEGKKSKKVDPRTYWGKVYKWRKTSTSLIRINNNK